MALRVLLADESSTIKKVFQLALQDFAVEVRPVNVGVDVVPVAQNFKPDIIFADVMLQKRSGYEVAADIKQNPLLSSIPVVLMWSGFIELDEDKFQASHANAQLEKPFDVSALRKLVTDLVPRTQNQRLSQFLAFPKMPEIQEAPPAVSGKPTEPPTLEAPPIPDEEFKQVPIPKMKGDKYRLNLKPEELEPEHLPVDYPEDLNGMSGRGEQVEIDDEEEEAFTMRPATPPTQPKVPPPKMPPAMAMSTPPVTPVTPMTPKVPPPTMGAPMTAAPPPRTKPAARQMAMDSLELDEDEQAALRSVEQAPKLNAADLEKIIREQSAEMIESVVWKVVPDLAAQIIERELNRLLKERDSQF